MKHFLTILFLSYSTILLAQTTAIPDANFEQALINLGYDTGSIDGQVLTANINTIDSLNVTVNWINDLTGIEDFIGLTYLNIEGNSLTNLDLSQNILLNYLNCGQNQLTSLFITQNTALTSLKCYSNSLTSLDVTQNVTLFNLVCLSNSLTNLDVTQNTVLTTFSCQNNQLTSLDVSQNTALISFECYYNNLTSLDITQNTDLINFNCFSNDLRCLNVKNGNNTNLTSFTASHNPDLTCIEADNASWSTTNWTGVDSQTSFSMSCPNPCTVGIDELTHSSINIYPNPTTGHITISLEEASIGVLSIRNYLGQTIEQKEFSNIQELNISLDGSSGLYFLQLEVGGQVITKKIVKQ